MMGALTLTLGCCAIAKAATWLPPYECDTLFHLPRESRQSALCAADDNAAPAE